jgi:hypothetical protein
MTCRSYWFLLVSYHLKYHLQFSYIIQLWALDLHHVPVCHIGTMIDQELCKSLITP